MNKHHRRSFSLIEVVLSLFIISIVFSAVGIGSYKHVKKKRFESELKEFQMQLQLAYDLVLDYNIDLDIAFRIRNQNLQCEILTDNKSLNKKLFFKKNYKYLSNLEFLDENSKLISKLSEDSHILGISYFGGCQPKTILKIKDYLDAGYTMSILDYPQVITCEKE